MTSPRISCDYIYAQRTPDGQVTASPPQHCSLVAADRVGPSLSLFSQSARLSGLPVPDFALRQGGEPPFEIIQTADERRISFDAIAKDNVVPGDLLILWDPQSGELETGFAWALGRRADSQRQLRDAEPLAELVASQVVRRLSFAKTIDIEIRPGLAFVAMPMNEKAHPELVDVMAGIRECCKQHGFEAERVDDDPDNQRVSHRIVKLIQTSEIVIADLTHRRPSVFWEAGYADAIGKSPFYVAKEGTPLDFDVQDYPVDFFANVAELKAKLGKRLARRNRISSAVQA